MKGFRDTSKSQFDISVHLGANLDSESATSKNPAMLVVFLKAYKEKA